MAKEDKEKFVPSNMFVTFYIKNNIFNYMLVQTSMAYYLKKKIIKLNIITQIRNKWQLYILLQNIFLNIFM